MYVVLHIAKHGLHISRVGSLYTNECMDIVASTIGD